MSKNLKSVLKIVAPCYAVLALMPQVLVADTQSDLSVTGFLRGQAAYSLKHDNPNNTALGLPDDQDFNLIKMFLVTDLDYKPQLASGGLLDSFRLFARLRANWDLTEDLSGGIGDYNAFPLNFKDDWTLARAESEEVAVELWEGFADLRAGNSWLRVGRQNIVWGEATATRLLDVVNPLDLTQHLFEGGGELFDHIRIPVWAARLTYAFESLPGYSVDAFVIPGDFVPTALPDRGSPFNLLPFPENSPPTFLPVPPFLIPGLRVDDDTDGRRGDWEGGIRLLGEVGGVQYTLNYLSKIDQDGVITLSEAFPGGFDPATLQVVLHNHRKRLDIFGASFNSFLEPLGAVLRGELTYTPDQTYAGSLVPLAPGVALPITTVKRDTTKWLIGFDRPTFVFPTDETMKITLEWAQTYREGDSDDITILNAPADKNETVFTIFLSQPIMHNQLAFEFLGLVDTDDAYLWQPQVRYQPGDHWRFALYANLFSGSETRAPRLGALKWSDEVNLAITYQY